MSHMSSLSECVYVCCVFVDMDMPEHACQSVCVYVCLHE